MMVEKAPYTATKVESETQQETLVQAKPSQAVPSQAATVDEAKEAVKDVPESTEKEEKETEQSEQATQLTPEEKEKLLKKSRRQVVVNVPGTSPTIYEDQELRTGEGGGDVVVLRRHVPSRSQTINLGSCSKRTGELRRQSLCMLKQGHTGEKGSLKFRAALRRDSVNEVHPGWESIRKLTKVIG